MRRRLGRMLRVAADRIDPEGAWGAVAAREVMWHIRHISRLYPR